MTYPPIVDLSPDLNSSNAYVVVERRPVQGLPSHRATEEVVFLMPNRRHRRLSMNIGATLDEYSRSLEEVRKAMEQLSLAIKELVA